MSQILLTGVAGFIGSQVAEAFLCDSRFSNYQLLGLDNFDPFYSRKIKERNLAPLLLNPRFRFIEGFTGDSELLDEIFSSKNNIEGVIHLAARAGVGPSLKDPSAYTHLNIIGSQALFFKAGQVGVKQFLFASSSSVYGRDSAPPFKESQSCLEPVSPYAATKRACEILAWNAFHLTSLPMTVLRFFTVYGPRQRPEMAIAKFTEAIMNRQPLTIYGDGSFSRDFTYIDDIVQGVLNSYWYRHGESHYEIFNLGNSKSISVLELVRLIENELGTSSIYNFVPTPKGEMDQTCADIHRAHTAFSYNPRTTIQEGIAKYIAWLREVSEFEYPNKILSTEHV